MTLDGVTLELEPTRVRGADFNSPCPSKDIVVEKTLTGIVIFEWDVVQSDAIIVLEWDRMSHSDWVIWRAAYEAGGSHTLVFGELGSLTVVLRRCEAEERGVKGVTAGESAMNSITVEAQVIS